MSVTPSRALLLLRPVPISSPACSPGIQLISHRVRRRPTRMPGFSPKCEASPSPSPDSARPSAAGLQIGSPVVVVEAPATLKTATAMPCLRVNGGLVNPGDVGRIVARKPKDVWAVRLAIGTYLIDGKHFKPLDLGEETSSSPE